jgi:hypothetical protein
MGGAGFRVALVCAKIKAYSNDSSIAKIAACNHLVLNYINSS